MRRLATKTESGFTMLELLVAMVIFMVVTASVWGVMKVALDSRNAVSNNLCLEVAGSGDGKIGARLLIFTCTLTDDQEWEFMPTQQKTGS